MVSRVSGPRDPYDKDMKTVQKMRAEIAIKERKNTETSPVYNFAHILLYQALDLLAIVSKDSS